MSKPYAPPIARERFEAMLTALYKHVCAGETLDNATAKEITDALYRLRAFYQADLQKSFSNKRADAGNLRTAQLAALLMDNYHVDAAAAIAAATGKPSSRSLGVDARTLKNRRAKLVGDVYWPTPSEYDAAVGRLFYDEHVKEWAFFKAIGKTRFEDQQKAMSSAK